MSENDVYDIDITLFSYKVERKRERDYDDDTKKDDDCGEKTQLSKKILLGNIDKNRDNLEIKSSNQNISSSCQDKRFCSN